MKKILLFASALAGMFFAASCQQENLEPVQAGQQVTFTIEAPAAMQTKAIADGQNVNQLVYEVWLTPTLGNLETDAQKLYQATAPMTSDGTINKAELTLDLVNDQKFTVLFWAQVKDTYDTDELTAVGYKDPTALEANDESLAAFYGVAYVDDCRNVKKDGTSASPEVILKRPFAQVNLCTLNERAPEKNPADYTIAIVNSKMTLKNVPTEFNVATGDVDGDAELEFTYAPVPDDPSTIKVNEKEYYYAGMNYVFAGDNLELTYDIQTSLNGSTNYAVVNNIISSVPVKENYRTNIVGNLLTSKTDYVIIVDAEFEAPEYVLGDEWSQAGAYNYTVNEGASATVLAEVLAHADAEAKAAATKAAGPAVTINLAADVVWETGAGIGSTPLLPEDSPISAVVINGNGKTFTATGKGVGQVRLANGALLTFNNVKVVDLSVSYAENSWEYGYLEFGGNLAFNDCQFVNAIMMESENAAFTNCSFNSNKDNEYAVWVNEGNTTFNGCTFTGARGLKVHEAYGSEVASVVVDGCTFGPLTMKPGIALGDLNAETSVTIQNSTFDRCQAGDQGLFIYETDTDVTTFPFVCDNNVVIPSGDAAVEQEDGTVIVSTAAGLKAAIAAANNNEFTVIKLADGTYTGAFDIAAKSVKIVAMNRHQATIDGLVHGLDFAHVTLEGVVLTNATPAASASARHNADYYCLGSYVTDWLIEDCIFNVSNQGQAAGKGAINIYAGRDDYELYDGYEFTVKNTVFNCNGERPIRGKTNSLVEGCTFVDQHRYAIQVQGNEALASETVKFVNNTIVNPCQTSGQAYVASVSISKAQLLENAAFIIEGNTDAKFVYDNHDNVKITTCTLNGATIAEGQLAAIAGVSDAKEVLAEAVWTKVDDNTYEIHAAAGMFWFAEQVNVAKNAFNGKTVKLTADIDLKNAAWTPVGQTGATTFNGVFDGQNHTIYNLNVNSEAQTGAHYSSGLFGWVESHTEGHGHLKNVTISGAVVNGHHNCGALVGYITQGTALVENCHVTGATITCTKANDDADGDKAGALIGNATVATPVKDCTAANSTVSAGRDAGQVIGAGKEANVTGCSATEVAVSANGTSTGKNVRNEVIVRLL